MLPWLTPAERRGVAVLVVILLLGAARDFWRPVPERHRATAPVAVAAPLAPAPEVPAGTGTGPGTGYRLDLNSATPLDLDALPGIGPVLAGRIVAHRERVGRFRRLEDLLAVRGVGPRLLERLRPRVVVGGEPPATVQSAQPDSQRRADSPSVAGRRSR